MARKGIGLNFSQFKEALRSKFEMIKNKQNEIKDFHVEEDEINYPNVNATRAFINWKLRTKQDLLVDVDDEKNFKRINKESLLGKGNIEVLTEHQSLIDYCTKDKLTELINDRFGTFEKEERILFKDDSGHTTGWENTNFNVDSSDETKTVLISSENTDDYLQKYKLDSNVSYIIEFDYQHIDETVNLDNWYIYFKPMDLSAPNRYSFKEIFKDLTLKNSTIQFKLNNGFLNLIINNEFIKRLDFNSKKNISYNFMIRSYDTAECKIGFNNYSISEIAAYRYVSYNYEDLPVTGESDVIYLVNNLNDYDFMLRYDVKKKEYNYLGNAYPDFINLYRKSEYGIYKDISGNKLYWENKGFTTHFAETYTRLTAKSDKEYSYYNFYLDIDMSRNWTVSIDFINEDKTKENIGIGIGDNKYNMNTLFKDAPLETTLKIYHQLISSGSILVSEVGGKKQQLSLDWNNFMKFKIYSKDITKDIEFNNFELEYSDPFPNKQNVLGEHNFKSINNESLLITNEYDTEINIPQPKYVNPDFSCLDKNDKSYILNQPDFTNISSHLINDKSYVERVGLESAYYSKLLLEDILSNINRSLRLFKPIFNTEENISGIMGELYLIPSKLDSELFPNVYDIFTTIDETGILYPLGTTGNIDHSSFYSVEEFNSLKEKYFNKTQEDLKYNRKLSDNNFTEEFKKKLDDYNRLEILKEYTRLLNESNKGINNNQIVTEEIIELDKIFSVKAAAKYINTKLAEAYEN